MCMCEIREREGREREERGREREGEREMGAGEAAYLLLVEKGKLQTVKKILSCPLHVP